MNDEMKEPVAAPAEGGNTMDAAGLLDLLHGNGLDDETIKNLLSDALASLNGPAESEMNGEEEAGKLLGVEL